jgi:hypothetical protein
MLRMRLFAPDGVISTFHGSLLNDQNHSEPCPGAVVNNVHLYLTIVVELLVDCRNSKRKLLSRETISDRGSSLPLSGVQTL